MMRVPKPVSSRILHVKRTDHGVVLTSKRYKMRILAVSPSILSISYTERRTFSHEEKPELAGNLPGSDLLCTQEKYLIRLRTAVITAEVSRETGSIAFYKTNLTDPDAPGELLFAESEERPHEMEEFSSYRLTDEVREGGTVTTADGTKDVPDQGARRQVGVLYHVRENFILQNDEAVYGMGQMEEPVLNLRGRTVYAHQANRKIAVPLLISSLGYGVLFDTLSPVVFRDSEQGSSLYGHAAEELDFYFLAGEDGRFRMEGVVAAYRKLTGKAALLPRWCFGYLQSKERYCSQEELLSVAETYRKKHIGLDGVILDWCSWKDGQWGQKTLDPERFPDAAVMNHALHLQNVHSVISIWPNMDESCPDYQEMREQGWKDQFNNGEGLTRWILSNHLQMTEIPAWYAQEGTICLDQTDTLNRNREASLAVSGPAGEAVLCNTGSAGMAFEAGQRYHCYLFLKADRPLQLTVALSDADGTLADDTLSVPASGEDYVRIDTTLTVARSSRAETPDPEKAYHGPMSDVGIQNPAEQTGMLKLTLRTTQGPVSARIGFASLMPEETYLGHGLRKDIVEKLADLHPGFMRFPGGCIVEGFSSDTVWRFRNEVGPVWERPSHQLLWHYRTTNGLGFHEFLQLCEDLSMEPMYVFNCGMTCQGRKPVYFTGKEFDDILQDTMDALEYALGGIETKWGSLRAKMGHPAPFRMTYLEIGNENSGPEYLSRYRICYNAIHVKYPQIRIVANTHVEQDGLPCDIVDEHFYDTAEFFAQNADFYSPYDRKGPKIFIGEQSVNKGWTGKFYGALGEAQFLIGAEQNQDLVELMSYAPLLENVNFMAWYPNLILFTQNQSIGIPSYYVWKLFGTRRGKTVIASEEKTARIRLPYYGGCALLGKYGLQYRNLHWTENRDGGDNTVLQSKECHAGGDAPSHLLLGHPEEQKDDSVIILQADEKQLEAARYTRFLPEDILAIFGSDTARSFTFTVSVKRRKDTPILMGLYAGLQPACVYIPDETNPPEKWNAGDIKPLIWKIEDTRSVVIQQEFPKDRILAQKDGLPMGGEDDYVALRAEGDGETVKLYADGALIHEVGLPDFAAMKTVVTETETEILIKGVNMGAEKIPLHILLDCGVERCFREERIDGDPDAENDFVHPDRVGIRTATCFGADRSFVYEAEPHSVYVLTLTKKAEEGD